jgi:type I restriction enzyme S subunit
MKRLAVGTTGSHARIHPTQVRAIEVQVPGDREQYAIANALDDIDELISALTAFIAKKQAIKQGMMQELLTGQARLPGFSMPWRTKTLDAVSDIDPETIPAETGPSQMIDYVSLEDVSRGRILGSSRVEFGNAPSRARRAVRPLDVLFGTVRPNLQSHALYRGGLRKPVVSTGFAVIRARFRLADPQFLFYIVMSSLTSSQVERIIAGSNYPAVSSRDVRMFEYLLPEITEQEAIGAALADAEAELTVLHARLQKARAVKQGMMQELLTGRTRLPVREAVA